MPARISQELEDQILGLTAQGKTIAQIAKAAGVAERTVRTVRARNAKTLEVLLPSLGDKRLTHRELRQRVALARDRCLVLLEASTERLGQSLSKGKQATAEATTVGILADKLRALDAYYQLTDAIRRVAPKEKESQGRAYAKLLWTLAASGSIPAARLLGKMWGVDKDTTPTELYFEDDDPAEMSDQELAALKGEIEAEQARRREKGDAEDAHGMPEAQPT